MNSASLPNPLYVYCILYDFSYASITSLLSIHYSGGGGGSRTIRRVDNTQVIDSRNCQNGYKGPITRSIVRLLYENGFRARFPSIDIASSIPQIFPEYSHFAEEPFGRDWSGHLTNQPMGAGMVSLVSRPTVRYRWLGFPREEEQL